MWSKKFKKCVVCDTTEKKHKGNGMCRSCWLKDWVKKNPERRKEHKRKEYRKNFKRYQQQARIYQQKNRPRLLKYWSDYHKKKAFDNKYEDVLKRDGHKCLLCDSEHQLLIHHIDWNNSNNDINNLATLCRRCHPSIHYSKNRMKIESELYRNMQK